MSDAETRRAALLERVTHQLDSARGLLDTWLQTLDWTEPRLRQLAGAQLDECVYNPQHRVPAASRQQHESVCRLRRLGLSRQQVEDLAPSADYSGCKSIVTVTADELSAAGLHTHSDPSRLSTEQRSALYDHVISVARQRRQAQGITYDEVSALSLTGGDRQLSQETPRSAAELLQQQRDYKRRRQTYRAKNVHTNRKSRTEVIRELIGNHMEGLFQYDTSQESELTPAASASSSTSAVDHEQKSSAGSRSDRSAPSRSRDKDRKRHNSRSRSRDRKKKSKKKKKKKKSKSQENPADKSD